MGKIIDKIFSAIASPVGAIVLISFCVISWMLFDLSGWYLVFAIPGTLVLWWIMRQVNKEHPPSPS